MYAGNLLKQLRAFIHTAQLGSVSLAAERLYLSQPSISQQIRALETGFGQVLFDRHGARLRLTPAGKALLDMATPIVERMDRRGERLQRIPDVGAEPQHGLPAHARLRRSVTATSSTTTGTGAAGLWTVTSALTTRGSARQRSRIRPATVSIRSTGSPLTTAWTAAESEP